MNEKHNLQWIEPKAERIDSYERPQIITNRVVIFFYAQGRFMRFFIGKEKEQATELFLKEMAERSDFEIVDEGNDFYGMEINLYGTENTFLLGNLGEQFERFQKTLLGGLLNGR